MVDDIICENDMLIIYFVYYSVWASDVLILSHILIPPVSLLGFHGYGELSSNQTG